MAPHHDADIDARQRPIIEIGAGEGLRDEARRGRKARRVVVDHQIIVDGLGDMDGPQRIAMRLGLLRDDADRVGTIVAANIKEAADLVRLQNLEDFLAIFDVRFVARRAERGRRGAGHEFEVVGRLLRQIGEILVDDSAHAVKRAVDALDLTKFARFQHGADQRLVNDGGRAAALRDENLGKIDVGQGNLREAVGGRVASPRLRREEGRRA